MSPLFGLVLAGGRSTRMGEDKSRLIYKKGLEERLRCLKLLKAFCHSAWISCRVDQTDDLGDAPMTVDSLSGEGPAIGILSSARTSPEAAWLVLACDFPNVNETVIEKLVAARDSSAAATAYVNAQGVLEPLFAIWEPSAIQALEIAHQSHPSFSPSPRATLEKLRVNLVQAESASALRNVNTREEFLLQLSKR